MAQRRAACWCSKYNTLQKWKQCLSRYLGKAETDRCVCVCVYTVYLCMWVCVCVRACVQLDVQNECTEKPMDIFRALLGLQTSANNLYGIPSPWSNGSRSLMSISRPWFQTPSCSAVQYTVTVCREPGCRPPAQGDTENTPMLRADCRKKMAERDMEVKVCNSLHFGFIYMTLFTVKLSLGFLERQKNRA